MIEWRREIGNEIGMIELGKGKRDEKGSKNRDIINDMRE